MTSTDSMKIDFSLIHDIDIDKMKSQFVLNEDDIKYDYTPFDNKDLQKYNPIYDIFFNMNDTNYDKIGFNHKYQIVDLENVYDHENKTTIPKNTFIKYLKDASIYWVISIIGLLIAYYVLKDQQNLLISIFFSFLAAITFPHTLVIFKIKKNK